VILVLELLDLQLQMGGQSLVVGKGSLHRGNLGFCSLGP
jgi:hypothetical protein